MYVELIGSLRQVETIAVGTRSGIAPGCDGCMAVDGGANGKALRRFVSLMGSSAKPKFIGMRQPELVEES